MKIKYWKRCRFELSFNALGMPMFYCTVHPQIKGKYLRAVCQRELPKKIKNRVLWT